MLYLIFGDDGELTGGGESKGSIVHDGAVVVGETSGVRVLLNVEVELDAFLRISILPEHQQRLISVDPRLTLEEWS